MVSKTLLLALATAVAAHPQRHRHSHGFGRLSNIGVATATGGSAFPTGGSFPVNNGTRTNSTDFGGTAVESPSREIKTVTISPVPVKSANPDDGDVFTAPEGAGVNKVANTEVDAAGAGSGASSTSCLTSTITTTSVELVTVTADAEPVAAVATKPVDTPTEVDGIGSSQDDASISLDQGTPTAAAFYGATRSYGGGWGQSQSSAVVPTTFATAFSSAPAGSVSAPVESAPASGASPSQSSSAPVSSTGGSSSGGKKGLSYNIASLTNAFSGKGISWAYNWAAGPDGTLPSGVEFVPMLWGQQSVSAWAKAAASAIASGSKHVLSFNEPDLGEQANMDPATAAKLHIESMNPLAGQVQIGSVAITNGAGTNPLMGIDYLNAWFKECGGQCKVDFVAFHWYDSASNFAYFKKHVQDVIDTAAANGVGKVWLTEFGASGSDSDVASFISQAVEFLDSTPAVERYAYFMVQDGILVNGNGLSSLGSAYSA